MHRTGISDGIDILQIHWQDYSLPRVYLDVFRNLLELRRTRRLRLDVIGLVNFDTKRVNEICEAMGPGEILTNQVQVSSHLSIFQVARFKLHEGDQSIILYASSSSPIIPFSLHSCFTGVLFVRVEHISLV